MALGRLLTRSTKILVSDTVTGASATYFIQDNLGPDFAMVGPWRGAMSVPGAWRAAILLSDLLGQVPWHAWRQPVGKPEEMILPVPPLLEQPYPPDTAMTTFSSWGLDLIWDGNAVGVVASRNNQGWPTSAIPVPSRNVGVRRVTEFAQSPLPVGALEYEIGAMRFGSDEIIHIKGPCEPGAVRGMGVLEAHLQTLNLAAEQSKQSRSLANHGVPTGVLESSNPDLTDDEAADLKAGWMASQSTRSIAVTNAATKFVPLSWNPDQLQLVDARKFTLNELELIFGMPVGWLGGTDSSKKYSNMSQDDLHLIKYALGGHLARFEQTLSLAFPRGTKARANLDGFLRADTKTRYEAHAIGIGSGFLTPDEVRVDFEHRGPMPEVEKPPEPDAFTGGPPDAGQAAA